MTTQPFKRRRHYAISGAVFALGVAIPALAISLGHLNRKESVIPVTHGLPFVVLSITAALRRDRSGRDLPRVVVAAAIGAIIVLSLYLWGWCESTHYRGGGVNFGFAFAYVYLSATISAGMVVGWFGGDRAFRLTTRERWREKGKWFMAREVAAWAFELCVLMLALAVAMTVLTETLP